MSNYKEMYLKLFNSVTDAIEELKIAQQAAEEMYIASADKDEDECACEDVGENAADDVGENAATCA